MLLGDNGEIKAGMGGKFNGQKLSEARKGFTGPRITETQRKEKWPQAPSVDMEALKKKVWEKNFLKSQAELGAFNGSDGLIKAQKSIELMRKGAESFRKGNNPKKEEIAAEKELTAQWLEEWMAKKPEREAAEKAKKAAERKQKNAERKKIKESIEREKNRDTWSQIPDDMVRLKEPQLIKKQTEKAIQYKNSEGEKVWIPKSVAKLNEEGVLIGLRDWFATKNYRTLEKDVYPLTWSQREHMDQRSAEKLQAYIEKENEYLKQNGLVKRKFSRKDYDSDYVTLGNQRYKIVEQKARSTITKKDIEMWPYLAGELDRSARWYYLKPVKNEE